MLQGQTDSVIRAPKTWQYNGTDLNLKHMVRNLLDNLDYGIRSILSIKNISDTKVLQRTLGKTDWSIYWQYTNEATVRI